MTRPSWDEYFMAIAAVVATRSDCTRDKVGAVIVRDNRIRSTGYNGAPAGKPGCDTCPRAMSGVPQDSDYDNCVAVHAEANSLIHCDRADLLGAHVYTTRKPCPSCAKLLEGAGVLKVMWPT